MNDTFLIYSLEHQAWWTKNCYSYEKDLTKAGVFSAESALMICKEANMVSLEELMVPVGMFA